MAEHSYTEVTSQGWFSRIAGALVGLLFGILLFIASFPLLFWNEGRAVNRINALEEGSGAVVSIGSSEVENDNDQKLVHLSGFADTEETLTDPTFGVSENALSLRREVQIFQWREEESTEKEKKLGGGERTVTTYSYEKTWSDEYIDSSHFKKPGYDNPKNVAHKSRTTTAQDVSLGAFELPSQLVRKVRNYQPITIDPEAQSKVSEETNASHYNGGYYIGENPNEPQVGDLTITFSKVVPQQVSVVAQQTNHTFQEYTTNNDGRILLLQTGDVGAPAMFETALTENTILTWILRAVGLLCMLAGLSLFLRPISVLADIAPIFGDRAGAGTTAISFLVAVTLSAITVAIAWVVYRPVIGITLLVVALAVVWLLKNRLQLARANRANKAAETAPQALPAGST